MALRNIRRFAAEVMPALRLRLLSRNDLSWPGTPSTHGVMSAAAPAKLAGSSGAVQHYSQRLFLLKS